MLKRILLAATLTCLLVPVAAADTYGDKAKAVDQEKRTITIPVSGKDQVFKIDEKVAVQTVVKTGKKVDFKPVADGLKAIKAGDDVVLNTERIDGVEVVTKITWTAKKGKK